MKDGRLEVSDLMAGDWVKLSKGNWFENRKVELIDIEMIAESVYLAEPIPLTKEILEKIGFVNDYYEEGCVADYGYIKHDGYTLTYKNEEVDAIITWCNGCVSITTEHGDDVQITIKYLHELQHAFKLCRIKKEIEL